jgi:hypothetical protein
MMRAATDAALIISDAAALSTEPVRCCARSMRRLAEGCVGVQLENDWCGAPAKIPV